MKIKALARDESEKATRVGALPRINRTTLDAHHPFSRAREYVRTLNAVKMEKMFARPFVASLPGHRDAISRLVRSRSEVGLLLSGAHDGDIRVWNLAEQRHLLCISAHQGVVAGMSIGESGQLYSCGRDSKIKFWGSLEQLIEKSLSSDADIRPEFVHSGSHSFRCMDHAWGREMMVAAGDAIQLWVPTRSVPLHDLRWDSQDSGWVSDVKFNPVERDVIAVTTGGRLLLFDVRSAGAWGGSAARLTLDTRLHCCSWNPMEAFNITVGAEDNNLYSFDVRKMDVARVVHKDHVQGVMSVDYSPSGRHFVSGSFDMTLRLWDVQGGHSRHVYHTQRMGRVWGSLYSADTRFVFSGSDDGCVRIWKSEPSRPSGVLKARQQDSLNYSSKLKERFGHMPEIRRISRHQHLPKRVVNAKTRTTEKRSSEKRKERARRAHAAEGSIPFVALRKSHLIPEYERPKNDPLVEQGDGGSMSDDSEIESD